MDGTGRGGHPIFAILAGEGRSKLWLARRAGISHSHVRNVASGMFRPGPSFRRKCAEAMGLSEDLLFLHDDDRSTTDVRDSLAAG